MTALELSRDRRVLMRLARILGQALRNGRESMTCVEVGRAYTESTGPSAPAIGGANRLVRLLRELGFMIKPVRVNGRTSNCLLLSQGVAEFVARCDVSRDPERFLQATSFTCPHLHARIMPDVCEMLRQRGPANGIHDGTPPQCKECTAWQEAANELDGPNEWDGPMDGPMDMAPCPGTSNSEAESSEPVVQNNPHQEETPGPSTAMENTSGTAPAPAELQSSAIQPMTTSTHSQHGITSQDVPPGFERYVPCTPLVQRSEPELAFWSDGRARINRAAHALLDGAERIELFFNPLERQIALLPATEGGLVLARKPWGAVFQGRGFLRHNGLGIPCGRHAVETISGGLVVVSLPRTEEETA